MMLEQYKNKFPLSNDKLTQKGAIPLKKSQGGGSTPRFAGISLQTQDWTDAVNHPEWQRDDRIIWGPDRCFIAYSTFRFSVKKNGAS